jgi:hypothetical protein
VQSLLAFAMTERGGAGSKSLPIVSELAPTDNAIDPVVGAPVRTAGSGAARMRAT